MALVVTGVGFLIHLYSVSYMADDPSFHRFLTYLNLFIFSMLVLILGDSLPILFVGWEGVGLCSYLLIGFWFESEANAAAGKKAFITNRIGDFGLLVAMGLLLYYTGALDWSGMAGGAKNLLTPLQVWPLGTHVPAASILPHGAEVWLNEPRYVSAATLVGLALFLGCAGKSAQFPLYVWLPDAMAGPSQVSALIHAATMVTAGVYLLCRMSFVMVLSPAAMFVVALTGAFTAIFAASIAFAQNDIKKVLAYSTVSQLGYMFLGVGVGAFTAGFFHVITHAFFKACMFLGAGSVIHAMHARIHDTDASQDMRNMGGLRKYMPYTFWTFALSWAAIVGLPGTSGFFSKDEILLKAYTSFVKSPVASNKLSDGGISIELFSWPTWAGPMLYAIGLVTALMTAFYMTRLFIGIFFGDFKGWKIVKHWKEPEHAHGHDDHGDHHHHHHAPGEPLEGPAPHESPWQMWLPLAILGGLAAVSGFFNAAPLHITPFDHWLEPVFAKASAIRAADRGRREQGPPVPGFRFRRLRRRHGHRLLDVRDAEGRARAEIRGSVPRLPRARVRQVAYRRAVRRVRDRRGGLARRVLCLGRQVDRRFPARAGVVVPGLVQRDGAALHPNRTRADLRGRHGARARRGRLVLRDPQGRRQDALRRQLRRVHRERRARARLQLPLGSQQRRQVGQGRIRVPNRRVTQLGRQRESNREARSEECLWSDRGSSRSFSFARPQPDMSGATSRLERQPAARTQPCIAQPGSFANFRSRRGQCNEPAGSRAVPGRSVPAGLRGRRAHSAPSRYAGTLCDRHHRRADRLAREELVARRGSGARRERARVALSAQRDRVPAHPRLRCSCCSCRANRP